MSMWTIFVHESKTVWALPPMIPPQYSFVFISEDENLARKIFLNRSKNDIKCYFVIPGLDLNDLWKTIVNMPIFIIRPISLADVIVQPDTMVINTNGIEENMLKKHDGNVSCISCGFVNMYAGFDIDPTAYKCFKCKSGW